MRQQAMSTSCLLGCVGFLVGYLFGTKSSSLLSSDCPLAVCSESELEMHALSIKSNLLKALTATPEAPAVIKTKASHCRENEKPEAVNMLSQSAEDKQLLGIFAGICNGIYVEMGALDGHRYSNTHVFNQNLGWKGILVEPGPSSFAKLRENRPNEIELVHAAVCKEHAVVHYIDLGVAATGGIFEFSAPKFRERFWKGLTLENGTPIRCLPLRTILANVSSQFFFYADFVPLDVEGGELQVKFLHSYH